MLISFSVENFRSFGDEVTLNMVASNKLTDHEHHLVPIGETGKSVLRAGLLYGANAAGKSNLVRAIDVAQKLIRDTTERRYPLAPFRFSAERANQPSTFEFRFLIGNRVFIYGFDAFPDRFTGEWLSVMKGDDEVTLFDRNEAGIIEVPPTAQRYLPNDDRTFATLGVLRQLDIRQNQLFLNRATSIPESIQGETLNSIIKWFTTGLVVIPTGDRTLNLLDRLHGDIPFRQFCGTFLDSVGTGVGSLNFSIVNREGHNWEKQLLEKKGRSPRYGNFYDSDVDVIPDPKTPGMVIERQLLSEHQITPHKYLLPFSEESEGTQSLLKLLPVLASAPTDELVVVLDELDRSLHPLICWEFVRFFSESCPGARKQLIVTTHEAHLLNQELLRRDEYWFVEKDERQQTQLTSLMDYRIRNDLDVEKGYLRGRFGGIPLIGGMDRLERLLNCGSEASNAAEAPPA